MTDLAGARTALPTLDAALLDQLGDSILPVGEATTLPPELYTSPDVLAFETEALFRHDWVCVGRTSRVADVGDWFTVDIVGEPIVIVRDKAGEIRAMSAVCQHRAMQVCEGTGNSSTFKCPYHHWNYGLDGRLLGAPAMERTIDFDKSEYGLPQLRVEQWQGFVFVNFDPDAAPLAPTLERYTPMLANFDLEHAADTGTFTLRDLPWNWKVMFENFNDGYHANRLHQFVQDFCPSSMTGFPIEWDDDSNVIFRTAGYTHIDGGFNATHRAIMPVFPKLTDEERSRSTFALMPPTLCFGTAPDQCFFFLVWPTGPETIDLEIGYLFHPSALEDPLFEQKLALSDMGVQVFVQQDQDATTKVQRGLRSRFAPRGRYSWQEESHVQFNRWLVQRYRKHSRPEPRRRSRCGRDRRVRDGASGGMEYRTLGRTGVQVSRYGLGTMVLGAWGNTDRAECIAHRPPRARRRHQPRRLRRRLRVRRERGDRRRGAEGPARARGAGHQVPQRDGSRRQPARQLAALDHPRRRRQPAPPADRPHRPLPDPPTRPVDRHRRDDRRPDRPRPRRQDPVAGEPRRSPPPTSSRRAGPPIVAASPARTPSSRRTRSSAAASSATCCRPASTTGSACSCGARCPVDG